MPRREAWKINNTTSVAFFRFPWLSKIISDIGQSRAGPSVPYLVANRQPLDMCSSVPFS